LPKPYPTKQGPENILTTELIQHRKEHPQMLNYATLNHNTQSLK